MRTLGWPRGIVRSTWSGHVAFRLWFPRAALPASRLTRGFTSTAPCFDLKTIRADSDEPDAPELGKSDNYINLLEEEDGSVVVNGVTNPDPNAPPESPARKGLLLLSTGRRTDQPLVILNNTVFLWRPPPLSPTAVMTNAMNERIRAVNKPGAAPKQAPAIVPGGWEPWLDKETGQDEIWKLFEVVAPKPDILIFGTGFRGLPLPYAIRSYLGNLGIQVEVQDTRHAASTYNLLQAEGRRVACALLPMTLPND